MKTAKLPAVTGGWAQLLAELDTIPVDLERWALEFALMALAAAAATLLLIAVARWLRPRGARHRGFRRR